MITIISNKTKRGRGNSAIPIPILTTTAIARVERKKGRGKPLARAILQSIIITTLATIVEIIEAKKKIMRG